MAVVGSLVANVVANTSQFRSGMGTAKRELDTFTGGVNQSIGVLRSFSTALGIGGGIVGLAGFARMARGADEFQASLNRSLAIVRDIAPEIRAEMSRTAHAVAYETKFAAKEVAKAWFAMLSSGRNTAEAMKSMPEVALFAQAGDMQDLAEAIRLATGAQAALGMKVKDSEQNLRNLSRVMDVLTQANVDYTATTQQFAEGLTGGFAGTLRMLDKDIEEGVAVLAAFAEKAVVGAEASTQASIALRDLTRKALENAAAFKEAGIRVYEFGQVRHTADILKDIEDRFASLTPEGRKAELMFLGVQDKSAKALLTLFGASEAIREVDQALRKSTGIYRDVAGDMLTPMEEAWSRLSASMSMMATSFFPPLLENFADLIDALGGVEGGFNDVTAASNKWASAGKEIADLTERWGQGFRAMAFWMDQANWPVFRPDAVERNVGDLFQNAPGLQQRWREYVLRGGDVQVTPWDIQPPQRSPTAHELAAEGSPTNVMAAFQKSLATWTEDLPQATIRLENATQGMTGWMSNLADMMKIGARDVAMASQLAERIRVAGGDGASLMGTPFAPAMLRGSQEAYRMMIHQAFPSKLRDPAEETAKAAQAIAKEFPRLVPLIRAILDKQTKPEVLETAF